MKKLLFLLLLPLSVFGQLRSSYVLFGKNIADIQAIGFEHRLNDTTRAMFSGDVRLQIDTIFADYVRTTRKPPILAPEALGRKHKLFDRVTLSMPKPGAPIAGHIWSRRMIELGVRTYIACDQRRQDLVIEDDKTRLMAELKLSGPVTYKGSVPLYTVMNGPKLTKKQLERAKLWYTNRYLEDKVFEENLVKIMKEYKGMPYVGAAHVLRLYYQDKISSFALAVASTQNVQYIAIMVAQDEWLARQVEAASR